MKNCEFRFFGNESELAQAAAREWVQLAASKFSAGHSVALSGGRISSAFFAAVVEEARSLKFTFNHVHFFWADERCVAPDHADSNFRIANEALFQPLAIALDRIHRIKGELPPSKAVDLANSDIRILPSAGDGLPLLDMVFLGIGPDGHIASLMPNALPEVENGRGPYLYVPNSPKPPPERITLSYAAICAARNVWTLITGEGKEQALHESLQPGARTPFGRVLEGRKETKIFSTVALS
jgi:6-phosphogluconolactonase